MDIFEKPDLSKSLIELAAAGSIGVFAGGYVFGTISHFFLRIIFVVTRRSWGGSHEVVLDSVSRRKVLARLHAVPGTPDEASQDLYAGAAFDYDILKKHHKGVHRWLFRRWNGLNIAANSISALLLSLLAGLLIGIPLNLTWLLSVLIFVAVLGVVGFLAWRDTMHMLRFMANVEANKPSDDRQVAPVTPGSA
jgi:hypothetical protein